MAEPIDTSKPVVQIKTFEACWREEDEPTPADLASEALAKNLISMKGNQRIVKEYRKRKASP
mgnify:CR=1 FL=1